jgi:prepilin-type N-terminal cleavage/methylation domain-containing protein
MQKRAGFTLLEVIIVIAIVGILATVAIPNFMGWTPRYKLKAAVLELTASLQYARMRAIKQDQNCTVTFNAATGTCNLDCLNKTVRLSDHAGTIQFSSVTPTATFNFTPRGLTDAGTICQVSITDPGVSETYSIRIMPTGAVDSRKQ